MRMFMVAMGLTMLHVNIHAAEIQWYHNYDRAVQQADKEHKNILLLMTSKTCKWCRKLEETTLEDETVVARINQHYVAVALTRGVDSYPEYLDAKMVPMSFFLTPEGRVINSMPGYWNVEDYHSILDDANYYLLRKQQ